VCGRTSGPRARCEKACLPLLSAGPAARNSYISALLCGWPVAQRRRRPRPAERTHTTDPHDDLPGDARSDPDGSRVDQSCPKGPCGAHVTLEALHPPTGALDSTSLAGAGARQLLAPLGPPGANMGLGEPFSCLLTSRLFAAGGGDGRTAVPSSWCPRAALQQLCPAVAERGRHVCAEGHRLVHQARHAGTRRREGWCSTPDTRGGSGPTQLQEVAGGLAKVSAS
jgi:hypothetical protein